MKLQWALLGLVAYVGAGAAAAQGVPQGSHTLRTTSGVLQQGVPPSEGMRQALSTLDLSSMQSGVLLDIGSMFATDAILQCSDLDISQDPGVGLDLFVDMVGDLARSEIVPGSVFPATSAWAATALEWRQAEELVPISLTVASYDRIEPGAYTDGRLLFDGKHFYETTPGTAFLEQHSFVASTILAPTLVGPSATFVLPSNLLLGGVQPSQIRNLQIQFAGQQSIGIAFDQAFTVTGLAADAAGLAKYQLSFDLGGTTYWAAGAAQYSAKTEADYADKGLITASLPYLGTYGKMYVRLYPATGRSLPMQKPIVIIDGIDVLNNRTFDDIWEDFGDTLQKLLDLGYDLVVCDYENGRDYIQRNGLAVREVLARLPSWQADGHKFEPAAIIAGSMGTQVARYALRTAEVDAEDHHVGLFVSVDGPYTGANIPIGLQGFVEFLAPEKEEVKLLLDGLNSPAASQLLRKNRYMVGTTQHYYEPKQAHLDYFAEANALGLPETCRNVAIASGSGAGTHVNGLGLVEYLRAKVMVNITFFGLFTVLSAGVDIRAMSDSQGQVFYGWMKKPGTDPFKMIWTLGPEAEKLDLAPGGLRDTAKVMKDKWNGNFFAGILVPMSSQEGNHCFIPTSSALCVTTSDLEYAPKDDDDLREHSPFDAVYFNNPNTKHASPTVGNVEFIVDELERFFGTREEQLFGDLCIDPAEGDGTWYYDITNCGEISGGLGHKSAGTRDELLSINVETRQAMLQSRTSCGWVRRWHNGTGPFIGSWYISPGDRFFLADVDGDEFQELICFDNSTPGRAMIQQFDGTAWQYVWDTANGVLGTGWTMSPIDRIAVGRSQFGSLTKDGLLAVQPYQHHSRARMLRFTGSTWVSEWSNDDNDMIGGFPVQLGNQYSFANLDGVGPEEMIAVNEWTCPVGWVVVQKFDSVGDQWIWLTEDINSIGTAWVRGAGDRLEFADTDGDGTDELHCFSGAPSPYAATLEWTPDVNGDWTMTWVNVNNLGYFGSYKLGVPFKVFPDDHLRFVDKYAWGFDGSSECALALAPPTQGPAKLLKYIEATSSHWDQLWSGTSKLGHWFLYQ